MLLYSDATASTSVEQRATANAAPPLLKRSSVAGFGTLSVWLLGRQHLVSISESVDKFCQSAAEVQLDNLIVLIVGQNV